LTTRADAEVQGLAPSAGLFMASDSPQVSYLSSAAVVADWRSLASTVVEAMRACRNY
jgi:hypothetical protein